MPWKNVPGQKGRELKRELLALTSANFLSSSFQSSPISSPQHLPLDDFFDALRFLDPEIVEGQKGQKLKRELLALTSAERKAERRAEILGGRVLRRNKAETLKGLRPTKEIWVTVPMAPIQVGVSS
jgi:hypothetical protein